MRNMNHGDRFERHGFEFVKLIEFDDTHGAPWDECDGHGPVREVSTRRGGRCNKRPGERVLREDHSTAWLYDWQAACKMARKDGWNTHPFDAPNRIERAVQADFEFLRRWLNDDWHYVGVIVRQIGNGPEVHEESLWGVETYTSGYTDEVARDLADEILNQQRLLPEQRREDWLKALAEARERRYWAQRDVVTA